MHTIGYLVDAEGENGFRKDVIDDRLAQYSSIMQLQLDSGWSLENLMRGDMSIGGRMLKDDYYFAPSPVNPKAAGGSYSSGGYSLRR